MSLASDLLQSWSRPPTESRRLSQEVLAALDSAMTDLDNADATQGLDEARTAYRRANFDIDAEKNPRLSQPPAQYADQFGAPTHGDAVNEEDDIRDPAPNPDPGILTSSEFQVEDPDFTVPDTITDSGDGADASRDGLSFIDDEDEDDTPAEAPAGALDHLEVEHAEGRDEEDTGSGEPAIEQTPVTEPAPVSSEIPSPTASYAAVASPFTGKAITPDPVAAHEPAPSPRATRPPRSLSEPAPDPDPSAKERLAESATRLVEWIRGADTRTKVLAGGAAAALVLTLVAVVSLSGGRGTPPEPAVAAPPAAAPTETAPDRTPTTLSIYQVSSSCEDSDPTAPFQPADTRDASKAWVCKRINGLDGNVLNIVFGRTVVITAITIVPGFDYVAPDGRDEWDQHRLVTGVTWRMANQMFPQQITPSRSGVTMKFDAVITSQMSMTITASERPRGGVRPGSGIGTLNNTDDSVDGSTAVSRIVITGYPLDPGK